jgi:hypothetical protein
VLPVIIGNDKSYRSAGRSSVPNAADDISCILLDLHPSAAAMAFLTTMKLEVQFLEIDR